MAAPVTVTVELYLNGAWTDITSYVRLDPGIDITHGIQAEGGTADPSTAQMVVNNTDGRFTPRNTAGAYYPYLKRNTPLRIKVGSTQRFLGEVSEFPTRWNENGKHVWAALTASGMLRRLQHAAVLQSTLTTAIQGLAVSPGDVSGYWPLEDEQGATTLASGLVGGTPGTYTGSPVFQAVDLSAGTHEVPTWAAARATFTPATATSTKFTAGFYVQLPATGTLTGGEELFRCDVNGTARSWRVIYSPASGGGVFLQVIANDVAGTELLATSAIGGLDGLTFYVKMECSNSGANVAYSFSTLGAGSTISGSIATATVGAPVSAAIGSGTIAIPAGADVAIGHVVLGTTDTTLFTSKFDDGRSGYAGESVETRAARLATANGITITVSSGATQPVEHGAQPDGSLLDVLRAMEKADAGGILRDSLGTGADTAPLLFYITRKARYNERQTVLALNYASGHLTPPLEPVDDDQQIRNAIKANRAGGSSARATDTTSALSSAAYPTGVGPYPFEDSFATYLDSGLPYLASWLLRRGTINETRWPAVTVDLVKNTSLVTDAEAIRPGHRITISNLPAFSGSTSVALQVIGYREHLSSHERKITFICEPGSPFLVFELNNSTYGRLDGAYRLAF